LTLQICEQPTSMVMDRPETTTWQRRTLFLRRHDLW